MTANLSEDTRRQPGARLALVRWQAGHATFSVPQAAAPIAFALLALQVTGSAEAGAAMVLAMTVAQVVGAVPVSRLGARRDPVAYLRGLLALRAVALLGVAGLVVVGAPYAAMVALAAVAGAVNAAAYGYQRSLLNHLVAPERLPRALGIAATLGEVTFALSPVVAAALGSVSPTATIVAVAVLGAAPLVLVPVVPGARQPVVPETGTPRWRPPPTVGLWLLCATAGSAAVATIEVGAVSFALGLGLAPGWAFLFALTLCCGSVLGGTCVSVRNRPLALGGVLAFLVVTTASAATVAVGGHVAVTLGGAAVIGFALPFLATSYSLRLDALAPPHRRAEVFALLRTAASLGVILVSGLIATVGLGVALVASPLLLLVATLLVAALVVVGAQPRPSV